MHKFETGLVSISFRAHTPEEIVKAAKKANLQYIEWGSDVHAPYDNAEKLDEIVRLQKAYGIRCSSYGTYFTLGTTAIAELKGYIAAAKRLGTDMLRLWCGDIGSASYDAEKKTALFTACRQAAEMAEKENVTLCMECHPNTYTDEKETALELMEEVQSSHFKMYWQPNQFKSFAENVEYLQLLKPYITHIHVFNWEERNRYPLSEGIDTWKKYLGYLGDAHILLLEFMPDNRIETLAEESDSLLKILEELQ